MRTLLIALLLFPVAAYSQSETCSAAFDINTAEFAECMDSLASQRQKLKARDVNKYPSNGGIIAPSFRYSPMTQHLMNRNRVRPIGGQTCNSHPDGHGGYVTNCY